MMSLKPMVAGINSTPLRGTRAQPQAFGEPCMGRGPNEGSTFMARGVGVPLRAVLDRFPRGCQPVRKFFFSLLVRCDDVHRQPTKAAFVAEQRRPESSPRQPAPFAPLS